MKGTVLAHTHARLTGTLTRCLETPTAVISVLVLSAVVTATSGYVVASKVWPHLMQPAASADLAAADQAVRPVQRPTSRPRPLSLPADPSVVALGFDDPAVSRSAPGSLALSMLAEGPMPRGIAPVRIVAGRPAVVPPLRPDAGTGLIQVASRLSTAQALGLRGPTLRPEGLGASGEEVQLALATRPTQRPVTFSSRTPAPDAVENTLVLATADDPQPARLSDPARPRASFGNTCSNRLARAIPRRPGNAADGSTVMAAVGNGSGSDRDNRLVQEALRGNVPSHMRALQPVRFTGVVGGRQTEITICVTPDYLAIGSDADNVRVPLGLPAALRVADAFDMMLPTTRMVDAIYAQADLRVSPSPMTPGAQMSSTDYFLRHDATVDGQFARAGARDGLLVAGHKKDLVIANRLSRAPGRVAIYGWHRSIGNPIQPLSTVHGEYYADYSHGIRLVSRTAYVNGRAVDLRALLTDGQYASLLNSEGPLTSATVRLAALR